MKPKAIKIIMWICITLLSLQFLGAGIGKFFGAWSSKFIAWGYSLTFMYIVGFLEIIGVVGLFPAITRKWSAMLLIVIMVGAAYTHVSNSEYVRLIHIGIVVGLAVVVIGLNQKGKSSAKI